MDIKTYGPAKLLIKNNVRILELRGTEEEMAFQHGTLLAQDIQKGPIPYLSKKFEFELQNDGPLKKHPLLQKVVLKYMDWVFKHLIAYIPLEYKKVVKALSTAANISEMDILRAASMRSRTSPTSPGRTPFCCRATHPSIRSWWSPTTTWRRSSRSRPG